MILKLLNVVKEIEIVLSIWVLFMFFVYGGLRFESVFFSLAMLVFLIFYRIQKNKNPDYLKPFRKFFWIGMLLLMVAAFGLAEEPKKVKVEKNENIELGKKKDTNEIIKEKKFKNKNEPRVNDSRNNKKSNLGNENKKSTTKKKELNNLSEKELSGLFLEIDSEKEKITKLFRQVNEENPNIVNEKAWRSSVLSHIVELEKNISIIKSSNIYKEKVEKNEEERKYFKKMELSAKSARLMYESVVEHNSKKMDEAFRIEMIEIPSVDE